MLFTGDFKDALPTSLATAKTTSSAGTTHTGYCVNPLKLRTHSTPSPLHALEQWRPHMFVQRPVTEHGVGVAVQSMSSPLCSARLSTLTR